MDKVVGIVGAGISGLLACKYTLSKGIRPIVFESSSNVGGVWVNTSEITKLQTPKPFFQFTDFPWPSSVEDDHPQHGQVLEYIEAYAEHFDLVKHIKFGSKVCGIEYEGSSEDEMQRWSLWGGNGEPFSDEGKWKVVVEENKSQSTSTYVVDFVILCVGRFSDVPNIPEFPLENGPEAFHGEVLHTMDYCNMDDGTAAKLVTGKQVTIVGSQKFALDIAMECSNANGMENPCTLLYRTEHWSLPDFSPWGVSIALLYFNRFAELLLHKPGQGFLLALLATLLSPLRWIFSKFVETYSNKKLGLHKYGMVPKTSFLQDISACLISIVPENFYDRVQEGSIILKKSPDNFSFVEEGILVNGDASIHKTDVVILATGFKGEKKLKDIFVSPTFQDSITGPKDAIVPLYRQCIHGRIPQLAVIGFFESISNLYTSEMRCRWVAELFAGTFKVPSIREMEKDVKEWDVFAKEYAGENYRRCCVGPLHIWYNDQLCKDMGWNHRRKKGMFAELFEPYGPMDYATTQTGH